jgi:hypothetical protein
VDTFHDLKFGNEFFDVMGKAQATIKNEKLELWM